MALEITVRGEAEGTHPAERAVVGLSASLEGPDRQRVLDQAVAIQEPLTGQLRELVDRGAVETWSSDQVRIHTYRPWIDGNQRGEPVHAVSVSISAEFTDFERLSGFVDYWSGRDGVEVSGIFWDVLDRNRRGYEKDVRKAAVDNAVAKAQAYADAFRRGRVVALRLADPGMLQGTGGGGPVPLARDMKLAAFSADGGGAPLQLTPAAIVIRVEVDAQFTAD
jgi:uncharacterized protein YggE